jgi:hypothetical protein
MPCARCGHIYESADMQEFDDDMHCQECYDHLVAQASYTKEDYQADQADILHASGELDEFGKRIR